MLVVRIRRLAHRDVDDRNIGRKAALPPCMESNGGARGATASRNAQLEARVLPRMESALAWRALSQVHAILGSTNRRDHRTGAVMTSASTEMIQVGALSVRFLIDADDSNGSVSVFECFVRADSR